MSGLLLAIDGDSLAHRAYHALPKSIQLNAVVGFAGFLQRLWEAEQPEALLVAWDSLETPTYRHEALPAYQSGREFEDSIVEQLALLPPFVESFGFLVAKAGGYEADDFLAAAARAWRGAGARRDLRPRRIPARLRPRRDPAARQRRLRARAHRPRGGARALRRRARAGAGLHRASRRPVGQDPRRARRRPEESGRRAEAARVARAGNRPTAGSHRSPTS